MTWYTFLLFVHVSMAIGWLGGALMMQFFALRAIAAGPERAVAFTGDAESGRLGKVIAEQGLESPEAQRRMARIILYSRIELVLLFLIVFDMTVKPEVGDAGAVLFGLGAAAAAAALIVWRFLAGAPRAQAPASARIE